MEDLECAWNAIPRHCHYDQITVEHKNKSDERTNCKVAHIVWLQIVYNRSLQTMACPIRSVANKEFSIVYDLHLADETEPLTEN